MGKGYLQGSPFQVEKIKGESTKRKSCYNCRHFDEGECVLFATKITENHARQCKKFESAYSNVEKIDTILTSKDDENEDIKHYESKFHKKNCLSKSQKEALKKKNTRMMEEYNRKKGKQKRIRRIKNKLRKIDKEMMKAKNKEEMDKLENKKERVLNEFKEKYPKEYIKTKKKIESKENKK